MFPTRPSPRRKPYPFVWLCLLAMAIALTSCRNEPTGSQPNAVAPVAAAKRPPQPAPQLMDETLTRAHLRPMRDCFHGLGYPTERPMSLGISIEAKGDGLATTVFAMTDVQVPEGVAKCLKQRVPAQGWPPGVYFADWPNDDNWP